MSNTKLMPCFEPLLKKKDELAASSWRAFSALNGFAHESQSYYANRLDQLMHQHYKINSVDGSFCHDLPYFKTNQLVFVDGHFCKKFSSLEKGAILLTLDEARMQYGEFIERRWKEQLERESSASAFLNGAMADQIAFIYLPSGIALSEPIHIIQHYTESAGLAAFPRIHFFGARASKAIVHWHDSQHLGSNWIHQLLDCHLEEGARLEVNSLFSSNKASLFEHLRVTLKKSSFCKVTTLSKSSKLVARNYRFELCGIEAEAKVYAATLPSEGCEEHFNVLMDHLAPKCRSLQQIKHVGFKNTRHTFEGKIFVHREGKETESYQKHQALLLDPTAFSASKPNLEILTDEVKASHGATSGSLDWNHLFYLTSRGLTHKQAEALLVQAHLQEMIAHLSDDELKKEAQQMMML